MSNRRVGTRNAEDGPLERYILDLRRRPRWSNDLLMLAASPSRVVASSRLAPQGDYDVVVIGGGVNGTGVARDCAMRGLRVALFERNDLGFGASGNSTGFIHGGPRYLLTDPAVTRDSCIDSGHIQRIAPHLVFRVPVIVPVERSQGFWALFLHEVFFRAYDRYQRHKGGHPHVRLSPADLREVEPGLSGDFAGAVTFDEWGVDGVRLCVLNALDASARGALVRTHCTVQEILRRPGGAVAGVRVFDSTSNAELSVGARLVVNATGAWAPVTVALGGLEPGRAPVRPGKGVHVYYDRRLTNHAILVRAIDGRSVFLLPWQNVTVIGTTDDDFYGDLDTVTATVDEVRYLVDAVARIFPAIRDARAIGTWAGVRPTLFEWGPQEDALSRDHRIVDHESDGAPGLYSMIGGKLASFRLFAEQMSDVLARRLGVTVACRTATEVLPGGAPAIDAATLASVGGLELVAATRLAYRHGARATEIVDRIVDRPEEAQLLCCCEPVTEAEVRFVVEKEWARTVDDVARRTRLGLGSCGGMRCAARCGAIVASMTDRSARDGLQLAYDFVATAARRRLSACGPVQARQEALLRAVWRSECGFVPGAESAQGGG